RLIREEKIYEITKSIEMGTKEGSRSMDQDLAALVEKKLIAMEDAVLQSSAPVHLREILSRKEKVGAY
ncbi:MAG: hypothetical protein KAI14_02840, partial [Dehalococcoidales bacterium]|nr:hypothetical protein [Dehalococcoidales bacterium]